MCFYADVTKLFNKLKATAHNISREGLSALSDHIYHNATSAGGFKKYALKSVEDFTNYRELSPLEVLKAHNVQPDINYDILSEAGWLLSASNIMTYICSTADYVDNRDEIKIIVKLH